MKHLFALAGGCGIVLLGLLGTQSGTVLAADSRPAAFEIRIVDKDTGRGVPLVELVTVHGVRYVTDNAGRIAYSEPGHAGERIYFSVHPQGYEVPRDGLGIEGVRFQIEPGEKVEAALARTNVAERLYRLTGQDLYRDSILLGHETPLEEPLGAGRVAGQDSVQTAIYRGKLYWFWGDTSRLSYPLGLFRTAGATSHLPDQGGPDPAQGIDYAYFVGEDGFARAMVDVEDPEGVVWIDGVTTVDDESGNERLVARFSRRPGLARAYEQGMLLYNDAREVFEATTRLPLSEKWRFLRDHPVRIREGGTEYLACGNPFPVTRVPATLDAVMDPSQYESWSCMEPDVDPGSAAPRRDDDGELVWSWQKGPPVTQQVEARWVKDGLIRPGEARFLPVNAEDPDHRVQMHSGTTHWNSYRQRWVMIAIENAWYRESPSALGEVWYSESKSPQGPFQRAVRVVSHDKQTFYNPCHHPFFDEQDGRLIYFEGTYCNTFTSAPATQRYNYNQVMYRLDLDHPRIRQAFSSTE